MLCYVARAQSPNYTFNRKPPPNLPQVLTLYSAIKYTLAQNPNILLSEETARAAYGFYQSLSGQFDPTANALLSHDHEAIPLTESEIEGNGDIRSNLITDTSIVDVNITKEFRNGVMLTPNARLVRIDTNINRALLIPASNRGEVNFTVFVPFLRGSDPGAPELAAKYDHEAEVYTVYFTVSQNVFDATAAYWQYLGAVKRVKVFTDAVKRAKEFADNVQKLIDGKELPRAEILLPLARVAERTAQLINAEQEVISTRRDLAILMGITYLHAAELPLPVAQFPKINNPLIDRYQDLNFYIPYAMQHRQDIWSELMRAKGRYALVIGTHTDLPPQLNFELRTGYDGLRENGNPPAGFVDRKQGPNVFGELTYQYPIGNNTSLGNYMNASAEYNSSLITLRDLRRTIKLEVAVATNDIKRAALELVQSYKSVEYYQQSVKNENKKLQLGAATVLDVIQVDEQLVGALLINVDENINYATSLARIRFEVGSLVKHDNYGHSVVDMLNLQ